VGVEKVGKGRVYAGGRKRPTMTDVAAVSKWALSSEGLAYHFTAAPLSRVRSMEEFMGLSGKPCHYLAAEEGERDAKAGYDF